jgi:hypothetical protein
MTKDVSECVSSEWVAPAYLALPRQIVLLKPTSVQRYQEMRTAISVGDG